jgi:hypothetical protein
MRAGAVFLSLVLVACSHPAVSIRVTGWQYHRAGPAPSAVVLQLKNPSQAKLRLSLEPVTGSGAALAADRPCPATVGGEATLIFACALPPDDESAPAQPLKIVAYDSAKHQISSSCAFVPMPRDGGFTNPGLTQWQKTDPNAPVGWLNSGGTKLGFLRRETIAGAAALHFDVPDSGTWSYNGWNSMWLRQFVPALPMRLAVRLYPEQPLERTGFPEEFFGIDVIDAVSHEAYFGIDPGLSAPTAYRRPGTTIYAFPGKLRAWNTIAIDTSVLAADDKFVLGAGKQLQFKVVSAKMSSSKVHMSGAFGGVNIATNGIPDPCPRNKPGG